MNNSTTERHIIQLRGTNGSGKSSLVRALLASYAPGTEDRTHTGRLVGVSPTGTPSLIALGKYPGTGVGGGCDLLRTQDDIAQRVWVATQFFGASCVFEGVVASTIVGRYLDMASAASHVQCQFHTIFLQPSLEECVRRVTQRRAQRGETRPLNPKTLTEKHQLMERLIAGGKFAGSHHTEVWRDGNLSRHVTALREILHG